MNQTVVGVFNSHEAAERAAETLASQGFERSQTERLLRTRRDVEVRRRMEVGDGFARPCIAEHHETWPREGLDPRAQ